MYQPSSDIFLNTAITVHIVVTAIIFLLPIPFEPVEFQLPDPPYLGDSLPENTHLQGAERILDDSILGPESLAYLHGEIYSGTADGKIVRISKDLSVSDVAILGPPSCANETECGRPLGLRFGPDGGLYVLDAFLGLFRINVTTGEKSQLIPKGTEVDGKPILFFNDLDVHSNGTVFFTHSSSRWHRHQHLTLALEGMSDGRLLKYDPSSRRVSVLMDGLALANGVQLSHDENFLVVAEGGRMRIHRYFLTGEKSGKTEIFAENLPGFVDNIRPSSTTGGGFWVAHPTVRRRCIYDLLAPRPWLRRLLLKFFTPETIFQYTTKPYGLILELSEEGKILQRMDDPTGSTVSVVSEVLDTGDHLYLGSYSTPFLARIQISREKLHV
ncbi:adipocyte plasma membrane-associated protein-like [Diadema antillarum]|uniref:adipocyte plasma membrane-associated protein-like n=1 Tax=Diadema antillarum TaxID=105358 RepID=UPI003A861E89